MQTKFNSKLILADGSIFYGRAFGAMTQTQGETVFNTGMMGYTESLTDPSYKGQLLCQTHPLIGNYGVSPDDMESDKVQVSGYIIHELCLQPSHWTSQKTLDAFLKEQGIPGISGIDTRALTKHLRSKGVMLGIIDNTGESIENLKAKLSSLSDPNQRDLVSEVTTKTIRSYGAGNPVVVIDCGVKQNIIRSLVNRGLQAIQVPADTSVEKIMSFSPKGILISNGPGDPSRPQYIINTLRKLSEYKIPMMGICLGTQIMALSFGCKTFKLKYGHRGQNHGCIDTKNKKCYIISQNHGYAIDPNTPDDIEVTYINTDDRTVEGISHKKLPIFGVQFHPEAAPGPEDTKFIFDKFAEEINNAEV
jgi:carbamoyl-phosphate synthase small subunit